MRGAAAHRVMAIMARDLWRRLRVAPLERAAAALRQPGGPGDAVAGVAARGEEPFAL